MENSSKFRSVGKFVYSNILDEEVAIAELVDSDENDVVLIDTFGNIIDTEDCDEDCDEETFIGENMGRIISVIPGFPIEDIHLAPELPLEDCGDDDCCGGKKIVKKFDENSNSQIASEINKEMVYSIKQFGVYSFEDKGPDEVMDITNFSNILKNKSMEDVADILNKFYDLVKPKSKDHAVSVISSIISDLDHRKDFEDLWKYNRNNIFEY